MKKALRFYWRLILSGAVMFGGFCVGTVLCIFGSASLRMTFAATRIWGGCLAKLWGFELEVIGKPRPGALYVGNHRSYTDIIIHSAVLGARFVAKGDDAMRKLLFFSRCIWADRRHYHSAKQVEAKIAETLNRGIPVAVYPEGTTNDSGLLKFKTTAFAAAIANRCGVIPVLTRYTPDAAWVNNERFFDNFKRVLGLKKTACQVYISEEMFPLENESRHMFATRVREAMLRDFELMEHGNGKQNSGVRS